MPKVRSPWPECYYEETDPLVRRELLTQAMAAGEGDPAENELRQKLWALRYGAPDKRGKRPPDSCIRFWVTATMCARDAGSRFGARAAAKELSRDLAALDVYPAAADAREQQLVYRELVHAMTVYLATCTEGSYNSQVFGLMKMKQSSLVQKITADIATVTGRLPRQLGMEEAFAPLRRAACAAFADAYPNDVGLLEQQLEEAEK